LEKKSHDAHDENDAKEMVLGHILRGDSLLRTLIERKTERKKTTGTPRHCDAGLNDDRWIWKTEGRSPTEREESRRHIFEPA